ncbi:MAG: hypothetical protein AAF291_04780 [Pseudomonadota bacterium]
MIEFVPVMLFILGWHPDRPGDISFERPTMLFTTLAECEETGAKIAERMSAGARDKSGARYDHRCLPVPAKSEFEEAIQQLPKKQR